MDWGDKLAFTCGRVNDPYRKDVEGSIQLVCEDCSSAIMVSPETLQKFVAYQNPKCLVCVQCFRARADARGKGFRVVQIKDFNP
jgi:hypothetical protein